MWLILGKHLDKKLSVFCVHIITLSHFNLYWRPWGGSNQKVRGLFSLKIIDFYNLWTSFRIPKLFGNFWKRSPISIFIQDLEENQKQVWDLFSFEDNRFLRRLNSFWTFHALTFSCPNQHTLTQTVAAFSHLYLETALKVVGNKRNGRKRNEGFCKKNSFITNSFHKLNNETLF